MDLGLRAHHVGCVVESIEESLNTYRDTLGFTNISEVYHISSQKVKVCFVEVAPGNYLELVEPLDKESAVGKLLKKRQSYYHMGYFVNDFERSLANLEEKGLRIITSFVSEAFNNKRCAFLFTEELHMIELIEND
ncbi:MAG: VOC family protein [Crocinitomicaceae bacterium]|nr:VOC family protein [Crocinitomicaceae bacterium]